jgi:uncharacterized protein YdaU (DUF1376 family)
MPLFVDAFLADTYHLTAEEVGCYLALLMSMWRRNGSVPNDPEELAFTCRMKHKSAKWSKMWRKLEPFFTVDGNRLTQKRLKKEWNYVQELSAKQRANANARWSKNKDLGNATAYAKPIPDACPHTHTHKEEKKEGAKAPKVFNENLFLEFWEAYPKKAAKGDALRAYLKALSRASHAEILAGAKRYKPDPKFTKHPATWLNADCWLDEVPKTNGTVAGPWKPFVPAHEDPIKPPPEDRERQLQRLMKARTMNG